MRIRPGSVSRDMSHPSHKGCLHLSFLRKNGLWTFVGKFGTAKIHRKDAAGVGERGEMKKRKKMSQAEIRQCGLFWHLMSNMLAISVRSVWRAEDSDDLWLCKAARERRKKKWWKDEGGDSEGETPSSRHWNTEALIYFTLLQNCPCPKISPAKWGLLQVKMNKQEH